MKSFFPMQKAEARLLVFLIAMAVFAFLPMWRTVEAGGMAAFGWLLAVLMIVSPTLAFLVFRRADRGAMRKSRQRQARPRGPGSQLPPSGSEKDVEA